MWVNDIPEADESKSTISVFLDTLDYRRKSEGLHRVTDVPKFHFYNIVFGVAVCKCDTRANWIVSTLNDVNIKRSNHFPFKRSQTEQRKFLGSGTVICHNDNLNFWTIRCEVTFEKTELDNMDNVNFAVAILFELGMQAVFDWNVSWLPVNTFCL